MAEAERLPDCLWEKIFSLLPVSSLVIAKTVCHRWNNIISKKIFSSFYIDTAPLRVDLVDDVYFVLFADLGISFPTAVAYRASTNRWIPLSLKRGIRRIIISGGELLILEKDNASLSVYNVFSGTEYEIAHMISSQNQSYVLGFIDLGFEEFQIVSVATVDRIFSQVYNSKTQKWRFKGQFSGQFALLGNSCYMGGILYCLSRAPDHLLAFNFVSGDWTIVDVAMPSSRIVCSHILEHSGSLLLIGGLEEAGDICKIILWKLELKEKKWKEVGCMPQEVLQEFRGPRLNHFNIVDCKGLVCFCNTSSCLPLICDLRGMRWWWPHHCPLKIAMNAETWVGLALEPRIGVLR